MTGGAGDALLARLLGFERLLRQLGLDVHTGRMLDVVAALAYVDLGIRDDVFHLLRTLLVHRHEDLEMFDRAFDVFWRQMAGAEAADSDGGDGPAGPARTASREAAGLLETQAETASVEPGDDAIDVPAWSDIEALSTKDFAEFSAAELEAARVALARLDWHPGSRRTRRWVPGRGSRLDLRRALRLSVRTGGDMVRLPRRVRRLRPRPIVSSISNDCRTADTHAR